SLASFPFFFSSRRRHTRSTRDWSSDVCSSDLLGLEQFLVTHNPANLINGFFLNDLDPVTGFDRPEAVLNAEIAIGAGLSLGFISAGVEGGIAADIDFNLSDLNADGKVRFDELAGNIVANSFNPLAIFDISGKFDLFLRAFYEPHPGVFPLSECRAA